MQMEGEGPWTGTVFGHLLERDNKRKSSFGEIQKSVECSIRCFLLKDHSNGFVCLKKPKYALHFLPTHFSKACHKFVD